MPPPDSNPPPLRGGLFLSCTKAGKMRFYPPIPAVYPAYKISWRIWDLNLKSSYQRAFFDNRDLLRWSHGWAERETKRYFPALIHNAQIRPLHFV